MKSKRNITKIGMIVISVFFLFSLSSMAQENVNIMKLLPEGAIAEFTHAYPNLKVTQVGSKKDANVSVVYRNTYLKIDGIEKTEAREKFAKYLLQYLENPNKRMEDRKKREDNEIRSEREVHMEMEIAELRVELAEARLHLAELRRETGMKEKSETRVEREMSPMQTRNNFIERMKQRYPKFSYKWVGMREGNVEAVYGDNSLVIKGVEDKGARMEIAQYLIRLQKQIDKRGQGEER